MISFRKCLFLQQLEMLCIAYPCVEGQIVSHQPNDGHDISAFTWHLLRKIKTPNQPIAAVLDEVSQDVCRETSQGPCIDCFFIDSDIYLYEVQGLGKLWYPPG